MKSSYEKVELPKPKTEFAYEVKYEFKYKYAVLLREVNYDPNGVDDEVKSYYKIRAAAVYLQMKIDMGVTSESFPFVSIDETLRLLKKYSNVESPIPLINRDVIDTARTIFYREYNDNVTRGSDFGFLFYNAINKMLDWLWEKPLENFIWPYGQHEVNY